MKKILSFCALLFFTSVAFSFDFDNIKPKGNVSSYTKTDYTIISKFGEYYRTPAIKYVHTFDNNGNETECISYGSKNEVIDRISYEYNNSSLRTNTNYYDSKDRLIHRCTYEYDLNGNITSETNYDAQEKLSGKNIYKYDGDKITESYYDVNGALLSRVIIIQKDKKPIEVNEYFGDGSLEQKEVYEYNKAGNVTSISIIDNSGAEVEKLVYIYSENGFLEQLQTFNKEKQIIYRIFYENNSDGDPVSAKEYAMSKKFGETTGELKIITTYTYEKQ